MKVKKHNKAICTAIFFYIIMAADILINSYIALKWFDGVPQISPFIRLGILVVNPISVSVSFVIATIFLMIGLLLKRRARKAVGNDCADILNAENLA